MSRYIDTDDLLKACFSIAVTDDRSKYIDMMYKTIAEAPTVDVKKVEHGKWKQTCVPDVFQCSNCKRPTKMDEFCDSEILRAYCPNCGAKMDGGDN